MPAQTNYSKRRVAKREKLKTSTVAVKSVIKPFIVKANKAYGAGAVAGAKEGAGAERHSNAQVLIDTLFNGLSKS